MENKMDNRRGKDSEILLKCDNCKDGIVKIIREYDGKCLSIVITKCDTCHKVFEEQSVGELFLYV